MVRPGDLNGIRTGAPELGAGSSRKLTMGASVNAWYSLSRLCGGSSSGLIESPGEVCHASVKSQ